MLFLKLGVAYFLGLLLVMGIGLRIGRIDLSSPLSWLGTGALAVPTAAVIFGLLQLLAMREKNSYHHSFRLTTPDFEQDRRLRKWPVVVQIAISVICGVTLFTSLWIGFGVVRKHAVSTAVAYYLSLGLLFALCPIAYLIVFKLLSLLVKWTGILSRSDAEQLSPSPGHWPDQWYEPRIPSSDCVQPIDSRS